MDNNEIKIAKYDVNKALNKAFYYIQKLNKEDTGKLLVEIKNMIIKLKNDFTEVE